MTGDLGLNTFGFKDLFVLLIILFHFAFMTDHDQELVLFMIKMTLMNHSVVFTRKLILEVSAMTPILTHSLLFY